MFRHRRYVPWAKKVVAIQVAQQIIRGWHVLSLCCSAKMWLLFLPKLACQKRAIGTGAVSPRRCRCVVLGGNSLSPKPTTPPEAMCKNLAWMAHSNLAQAHSSNSTSSPKVTTKNFTFRMNLNAAAN